MDKKAQNKRTKTPFHLIPFNNKEEFIKRIKTNEPMPKSDFVSHPCRKINFLTADFQSNKATKKQVVLCKLSCVPQTDFISKETNGYIPQIKHLKVYKV